MTSPYATGRGSDFTASRNPRPPYEKRDSRTRMPPPRKDFISEWCKLYGLDDDIARYLDEHGYMTGDDILTLYVPDVNKFNMDVTRKCLLRGAILQYRQLRDNTDKELERRGVVVINKANKKKDFRSMWRHQTNKLTTMDSIVMTMLKPDERERIRDLRRRLHTKRGHAGNGGPSLYERILQNRGLKPTGSVSDGTESISSDSSSYKSLSPELSISLPGDSRSDTRSPDESIDSDVFHTANNTPVHKGATPRRQASLEQRQSSVDTAPDVEPAKEKPKKSKKKSSDSAPKKKSSKKKKEAGAEAASTGPAAGIAVAKETKPKVEEMPEVELENKLDEMLNDLDRLSKEPMTPTTPMSREESAHQTELALKKLEEELFTEEELALLEQAKRENETKTNGDVSHNDDLEEEIRSVMQM